MQNLKSIGNDNGCFSLRLAIRTSLWLAHRTESGIGKTFKSKLMGVSKRKINKLESVERN